MTERGPDLSTKFHFKTIDGKGGTVIYPERVPLGRVIEDCRGLFGKRFKEARRG